MYVFTYGVSVSVSGHAAAFCESHRPQTLNHTDIIIMVLLRRDIYKLKENQVAKSRNL